MNENHNPYNDLDIIRRQEMADAAIYALIKSMKEPVICLKTCRLSGMPPAITQSLAMDVIGESPTVRLHIMDHSMVDNNVLYTIKAWWDGTKPGGVYEVWGHDMIHLLCNAESVWEQGCQ